jgi:hypothetical protein
VSVNGRSAYVGKIYNLANRYMPEDVAYFTSTIAKRLYDRIFHIFFIRKMLNPYAEATQKLNTMSDQDRMNAVTSLFDNHTQPLFLHVHMMGTHGGNYYNPRHHVFSSGEKQTKADMVDYYDDAVLDYDQYMNDLVNYLTSIGELDQTMIIIYTDHGWGGTSNLRIPLMIRFPKGEYAGKIVNNTQNLDIAPTILDYMGINPPDWMIGQSLLKGAPPATRPIFSAAPKFTAHNAEGRLQVDLTKIKPPFYQFGIIGMVLCQKWYTFDTYTSTWKEAEIQNYPTPCKPDILPNQHQAQQIMMDQLKTDGFDISTMKAALDKK